MNQESIDYESAVAQVGALLDRRRLNAARDVLGKALPQYPNDVVLLQYSAWVDWMENYLDRAVDTVGKILEIEPQAYEARYLLGKIHTEREQFAEAERVFIDLLQDYPDEPQLYAAYAEVMLNTFNIGKAEQLATEALKRDPEHASALHVHALCGFIQSSGNEQLERLRKLQQAHPDQLQTSLAVVQLLIDRGRNREAYELARELVATDPGNDHIVELANHLRHASHWSLVPLWPMRKWGWGGSIAIWVGAIVMFRSGVLEDTLLAPYVGVLAGLLLAYVIYSWVWPPVLRKLLG